MKQWYIESKEAEIVPNGVFYPHGFHAYCDKDIGDLISKYYRAMAMAGDFSDDGKPLKKQCIQEYWDALEAFDKNQDNN